MVRTGWFECSNEQVNRLHENVVWSLRGNFVDLPTDCPQRDERLGWTGDIQIFAPVAAFLYDCHGMLASWLRDAAAEQYPDGCVPWYVPEIPGGEWTPAQPGAGWGDVAALTPDWLDPAAPPDDPGAGRTDRYLIATAYYACSARHVARMAGAAGRAGARRRRSAPCRTGRRGRAHDPGRLHRGRTTPSRLPVTRATAAIEPHDSASAPAEPNLAEVRTVAAIGPAGQC